MPTPDQIVAEKKEAITTPQQAAETGQPIGSTVQVPTGALVASNATQMPQPKAAPSTPLAGFTITKPQLLQQIQGNELGRGVVAGVGLGGPDIVGASVGGLLGQNTSSQWQYLQQHPAYLVGDIAGLATSGLILGEAFGAGAKGLRIISQADIPIASSIAGKLVGPVGGSGLAAVGRTAAGGAALSIGVSEGLSLATSGQPLPVENVLVAGALGAGVAGGIRAIGIGAGYVKENIPGRPDWMSSAYLKDVFTPKPSEVDIAHFNEAVGGMENRTPRTFEDFKPEAPKPADVPKPVETGGSQQQRTYQEFKPQAQMDLTGAGLEQFPLGKQRYRTGWEVETTVLRYPPETKESQITQQIVGLDVGQRQPQIPKLPEPQLQRQPEPQIQIPKFDITVPQIPKFDIPAPQKEQFQYRYDEGLEQSLKAKAGPFTFPSLAIRPAEPGSSPRSPWKAWGYREFHAEISENPLGGFGKAMKKGRKK